MPRYQKYKFRHGLVVKEIKENTPYLLHYRAYELVQVKWLQYNEQHASVPLTLGRSKMTPMNWTDDRISRRLESWFDERQTQGRPLRIQHKGDGVRAFTKDEWQPATEHTLKLDIKPFGGQVRVYQRVYLFAAETSEKAAAFSIRANELAVGGEKLLDHPGVDDGFIEVMHVT
ncbi:hypothetical protein BDW62DRAFT_199223 [Aspergillus aurantiobrunneus]